MWNLRSPPIKSVVLKKAYWDSCGLFFFFSYQTHTCHIPDTTFPNYQSYFTQFIMWTFRGYRRILKEEEGIIFQTVCLQPLQSYIFWRKGIILGRRRPTGDTNKHHSYPSPKPNRGIINVSRVSNCQFGAGVVVQMQIYSLLCRSEDLV